MRRLNSTILAALLLTGCSGRLNERAGLMSDTDLPALDDASPSSITGGMSVASHDRSIWPTTTVVLTRDNITHHQTYAGQPAPAFATVGSSDVYPTPTTAMQPVRDDDVMLVRSIHESALALLDIFGAPVRMILGDLPQSVGRSPGGAYALDPASEPTGPESPLLDPPFGRRLERTSPPEAVYDQDTPAAMHTP